MQYPYDHDEHHASTAILRKWLWSQKTCYWRQPVSFGPMPGPRQDFFGNAQKDWDRVRCTTATIKFKTSATLLRNLFPTSAYTFKNPGTIATASIRVMSPTNLAWLGGQGYDLMGFYIHDVTYTATDGRDYTGAYLPVMFENLADPIMTGREELGYPKLYSDIDIQNDGRTFKSSLSWRGATWAEFTWPLQQENGEQHLDAEPHAVESEALLVHRRMPVVGNQTDNRPDADYAAYSHPQNFQSRTIRQRASTKDVTISFTPLDWQKLPTLHHIVERLAELPNLGIVDASVVETEGWTDFREIAKIDV